MAKIELERPILRLHATGGEGDRLAYKLAASKDSKLRGARSQKKARKRPRSAKPKPKPQLALTSELLEVEWDGAKPVVVLIEAGTSEGIEVGQRGELVVGDKVIGQVEVIDVYSTGSRVRIVGELGARIDSDTVVRIRGVAR